MTGLLTSEPDSPTVRALDAMLSGRLAFLLSPELLREYREVRLRPRISERHGLSEAEVDDVLAEITANAVWREPSADPDRVPPDPQDALLWNLLASEPFSILVTGDRLLLERPGPGTSVVTPATLAQRFLR